MEQPKGEIVIYQAQDGEAGVEVRLVDDTVWLNQRQMSALFQKDVRTINEHIKTLYSEDELDSNSTIRNFRIVQQEGSRQVIRDVGFYNLDVVISVGYRVKSMRGTQFRIWATQVLRDHIVKGFTVNQRRLAEQTDHYRELQEAVKLIGDVINQQVLDGSQAEGLLRVITDYAYALSLLDDYDHGQLSIRNTTSKEAFRMTYEGCRDAIDKMAQEMRRDGREIGLFGIEKDESLKSSLGAIYQTFDEKDLYPSIEEKAAHLLYFVVKNHSFTDGNKRIGAFLFLQFMDANGILYADDGGKRIGDNALVALTLMIAESKPKDRDTIIKVVVNLINRDN